MKPTTLAKLIWTLALTCAATAPGWAGEPLPAAFFTIELGKLSGLVGVWDTTAKYRFTPTSNIFESKSVDTVKWSPNRHYLITDIRGLMPDGWRNQLVITSWNPTKKEYALVVLTPGGDIIQPTMTIEGGVRTILYYSPLNGCLIRTELTQEDISPTERKFRCECTDEGKTWLSTRVPRERSPRRNLTKRCSLYLNLGPASKVEERAGARSAMQQLGLFWG